MTTVTVKSAYSQDAETVRRLEGLAKRWNTSRSAALRRVIHAAAKQTHPGDNEALDALDALDRRAAEGWAYEVSQERRAASERNSSRPQE
ncbi:MAG: hypothetical protein OXC08_11030 [Thiotrichales bacterium]|nr:hypothetical protein [Thiotrichales bacterium]